MDAGVNVGCGWNRIFDRLDKLESCLRAFLSFYQERCVIAFIGVLSIVFGVTWGLLVNDPSCGTKAGVIAGAVCALFGLVGVLVGGDAWLFGVFEMLGTRYPSICCYAVSFGNWFVLAIMTFVSLVMEKSDDMNKYSVGFALSVSAYLCCIMKLVKKGDVIGLLEGMIGLSFLLFLKQWLEGMIGFDVFLFSNLLLGLFLLVFKHIPPPPVDRLLPLSHQPSAGSSHSTYSTPLTHSATPPEDPQPTASTASTRRPADC